MAKIKNFFTSWQRISTPNKIFMVQNLSIMIKTGVPLAEALDVLAQQVKNNKLKNILANIRDQIKKGCSFGESLETYQRDFGELFINMIKAGEASGRLEEVLHELYLQSKKDHDLLLKVRNALTYPAIILVAMVGIGIFIITFVLPNITKLFKDLDVELPLATRIIISINDLAQSYGLIILTVIIIVVAILVKALKTKTGKRGLDLLLLKTPIVASVIKKINLARLSRSLSALIKADIPIIDTLNITSRVVGNHFYREALNQIAEQVRKGEKMGNAFRNYPHIFPAIIDQMVAVGEETGSLDEVLEKLADFYEEEVYQTMNNLPTIIEPLLMLVIGLGVAGIALGILMPMYSLSEKF
ncbi:MAG: type II secretion system F family protein [Patescibacteria group bacterium]